MEAEWTKANDGMRRAEAAGVSQPQHALVVTRVGTPAAGRRASGSVVPFGSSPPSSPPGAVVRGDAHSIVTPHATSSARGEDGGNAGAALVPSMGSDGCGSQANGSYAEDQAEGIAPVAVDKGPARDADAGASQPWQHHVYQQQARQRLQQQQVHVVQQQAQVEQPRAGNSDERRPEASTGAPEPPIGGSLFCARRPSMASTRAAVGPAASTELPRGVMQRRASLRWLLISCRRRRCPLICGLQLLCLLL